jgi:hypothetical protein
MYLKAYSVVAAQEPSNETEGCREVDGAEEPRVLLAYADMHALFFYLVGAKDNEDFYKVYAYPADGPCIEGACWVYDKYISGLEKEGLRGSKIHELLLQSKMNLLFLDANTGHQYSPALIRSHLEKALDVFPANTLFLEMYAWNERHLRVDGRVRSLLRDKIFSAEKGKLDTVPTRLFAIRHEMKTGNENLVRAAFEAAVSSPATQSSAAIWKLYVMFAAAQAEKEVKASKGKEKGMSKAAGGIEWSKEVKEVFYRAVRACPWCKRLYMMAFDLLYIRGLMDREEVMKVHAVMKEKEIRLRVDIETFLEE